MARKAIVVGGNGQIGRAAALVLRDGGYDVTIAHRSADEGVELDGMRIKRLDRENTPELLAATSGQDVVIDTVAYSTDHAAQLAHLAGKVNSLVVISTGSVYQGRNGLHFGTAAGDDHYPDFPVPLDESSETISSDEQTYGPMKSAMERALLTLDDLPVSILRPGAVHGPYSPKLREWYFIKRVLDGRPRVVLARDGLSQFSTSSTANIAALTMACVLNPGRRVFNAVDDEQLTLAEKCRTIFEVMGHSAEILTFSGPPKGLLGADPWDSAQPFVNSMARARNEVGYRPAASYADAVQLDLDWLLPRLTKLEHDGGSWHELFPSVVKRYGPDGWFPYAEEDRFR